MNNAEEIRLVHPARGPLRGAVRVPGDKSIAHRAVMFNAAAEGAARVSGLPLGADVRSTVAAMRSLGCSLQEQGGDLLIEGRGLHFDEPASPIDCGNSGTTMRLLAGLLAGVGIEVVLDGDASLRRRPMERVAAPLRAMGAQIETTDGHAPVRIRPASLQGESVALPVASAQLKSAVLLAGLSAVGRTEVTEPAPSRDHTERMLASMSVSVQRRARAVSIYGPEVPSAVDVDVCGDPSSAAFFAVAAVIVPGSQITIDGVCLNPTRIGFVEILRRMGADVEVRFHGDRAGEPVGSIRARASSLQGVEIGPNDVPSSIDELPVLAVAAACASGKTSICGAGELRVKESDRVASVTQMLRALGVDVAEHDDGMTIEGGRMLGGARVATRGDHRLVMSAAVAALACRDAVEIEEADCASISFPEFFMTLETVLP